MTENFKKQVIDWFNSPQDYDQGVELLNKISKKSRVLGKLVKRGETRASFEKLTWELNKYAGLKKIPVPQAKVAQKIIRLDPPAGKTDKKGPKQSKDSKPADGDEKTRFSLIGKIDINSFSTPIQRIVRENSSLYMLRGKKHKALTNLPDDNSKETMRTRVELITEIEQISKRLEILFEAWKAFEESGTEPKETDLWPDGKTDAAAPKKAALDLTTTNIEDLNNLKKNIQSSITKDRNQLLFSGKTKPKDGKENPMPAGPKRTTLEKRIAKKEKEINSINQRIADLG